MIFPFSSTKNIVVLNVGLSLASITVALDLSTYAFPFSSTLISPSIAPPSCLLTVVIDAIALLLTGVSIWLKTKSQTLFPSGLIRATQKIAN